MFTPTVIELQQAAEPMGHDPFGDEPIAAGDLRPAPRAPVRTTRTLRGASVAGCGGLRPVTAVR